MNERPIVVGVDIGTSATKATAIIDGTTILHARSVSYPTYRPQQGSTEQDPDDWWRALGEVLGALASQIDSLGSDTVGGSTVIGLTGQMHTSVLRGDDGRLLRPAILWSDQRAVAEARQLNEQIVDIEQITGNTVRAAFRAAHLRWLARHEPDVLASARRIAVPKDDLRRRLGAGDATEPSDASGTGLLDIRSDSWSSTVLEAVPVGEDQLPPIVASHFITGEVTTTPTGAEQFRGAAVVGGAGDQAALAIALGVIAPGDIGISVGTSGVVFRSCAAPAPGTFRHALESGWLELDSTHAAGLAIQWLHHLGASDHSPTSVDVSSTVSPYRSNPPIFLPYLQGHRDGGGPPGALIGIGPTHNLSDVTFAVLEGLAFDIARLVDSVAPGNDLPDVIRISGGGSRDRRFRQLLADVLDRPIAYSDRDSAFGAAALAAQAIGWRELGTATIDHRDNDFVEPDAQRRAVVAGRRARFDDYRSRLSAG